MRYLEDPQESSVQGPVCQPAKPFVANTVNRAVGQGKTLARFCFHAMLPLSAFSKGFPSFGQFRACREQQDLDGS